MSTFTIYTTEGKEAGTVERSAVFSVPVDNNLIHRYFIWVRSVIRPTVADTKTRGEVSGGGRKPWKQKGTGRARSGSTRNPIWRTGGTMFGPLSTRTYTIRMPRGERRKALMSALSAKAESNSVVIIDSLNVDKPSTKIMTSMLKTVPGLADKKVLFLVPSHNELVFKAGSNISRYTYRTVSRLNIIDILNADVLLLTKESLQALENQFTPSV